MDPTRRVPVRRPLATKPKRYLVRLWEIPRSADRSVKPAQIEPIYVEASTQGEALKLAKDELRDRRRRVIRSISMHADGVIHAILIADERRARPTAQAQAIRAISTAHLSRRARAQRATESVRAAEDGSKPPRPTDAINAKHVKRLAVHVEATRQAIASARAKPISVDEHGMKRRREIEAARSATQKRRSMHEERLAASARRRQRPESVEQET